MDTNPVTRTMPIDIEFYQKNNYNLYRRQTLVMLSSIFSKYPRYLAYSKKKQTKLIKIIERSYYHASLDKAEDDNIRQSWANQSFVDIYIVIKYRGLTNLDPQSLVHSDYLINAVFNKEIDMEKIGYIDSKQLCSERDNEIISRINKRREQKVDYRFSKFYKCEKCKKSTCITSNVINRSLDEGTSVRIKCVSCGYERNA